MNELNGNVFLNNFDEFNNFNSNEVFFSPSAYSPLQLNQNNNNNIPLINPINTYNSYMTQNQYNQYYQNFTETDYSSPQLIKFSPVTQMNSPYQNPFTNEQYNFDINFNNNTQIPTNQLISNSPLISKIMFQFRDKLYPLLKKFFMDFANKLINDEPLQLAVIDLDKTSTIDYDTGCYSFPLGANEFKYKVYNLFDNLKSIAR